ncbi:tetratricopeptide repeat protein [Herpetosiphon gulosus]|uniref:NB-ARC domain-containing protein n=1 Tax=Herpetosiphon gulosus TaxID=1973496 RepID=A0ABP9X4T0_9CHLR
MTNSISDFFGSNNAGFGDVNIDAVVAGNNNQINKYLQLPAQTDPLPAALARLARLPQDRLPERSQLPPYSVMPYVPLNDFVGREAQLYQLAQAMLRPDPTMITPTAFATGMGGIGKSSLALEFAHRYGSYFAGGVFWLYAATNETLQASLDRCWDSLKPDEWRYEVKPETRLQVVRELFNQPMPRLLIFDNCEDPALFTAYRPQASSGCQVLVTSRRSQWQLGSINLIVLDTLPPLESRQLLQQLAAQPNINNYLSDDAADQLAELVGHLPLALHLVGSSLKFYFRKPAAEYITALRTQRLASLQAMVKPTSKLHQNRINNFWSVRDTVELSYGLLPAESSQACRRLLLIMAYCAPNVLIPWELLQTASGYDDDSLTEYLWELAQAGFFNDPTQPRLHPLMADVIIDLDAANEPECYASVEQALITLSKRYHDQWAMHEIEMLLPHLEYAHRQSLQRPTYDGQLAYQTGLCLQRQGKYPHAELLYREALGRKQQASETLIIKYKFNLASSLGKQGLYTEAKRLYREILEPYEQMFAKDHPDSIIVKHNLAGIFGEEGAYAQAELLIRDILAVCEQTLGSNHPDTLAAEHSLAWAIGHQDRYPEAEQLYRKVLVMRELLLGANHPDTLATKHGLAWALGCQTLYAEAESIYREVLVIREQTLGNTHPDSLTTKQNLAAVIYSQGRNHEAELLLQQVFVEHEKALGKNDPTTQATQEWLELVRSKL